MNERQNLSTEFLDQLRAGLLEDDPKLKSQVEAILREDQKFAAENDRWEEIRRQLDSMEDSDIRLKNQLRLRRRSVLSGRAGRKTHRFTLPQMALATATSVAVTLSAVLWYNDFSQTTVVMEPSGDTATKIAYPTSTDETGEFDLTNNVDFYVWMEHQSDLFTQGPRNGT